MHYLHRIDEYYELFYKIFKPIQSWEKSDSRKTRGDGILREPKSKQTKFVKAMRHSDKLIEKSYWKIGEPIDYTYIINTVIKHGDDANKRKKATDIIAALRAFGFYPNGADGNDETVHEWHYPEDSVKPL